MHGYSISWFGTGTSIKGDGVKLVLGLNIFYSHLYLNEIEQDDVPIQVLFFLHIQGIIR